MTHNGNGFASKPVDDDVLSIASEAWSAVNDSPGATLADLDQVRASIKEMQTRLENQFKINVAYTNPNTPLVAQLIAGVAKVQSVVRAASTFRRFLKMKRAAVRIQTAWRAHSALSKWKRKRELFAGFTPTAGVLLDLLAAERECLIDLHVELNKLAFAEKQGVHFGFNELSRKVVAEANAVVFIDGNYDPIPFHSNADALAYFRSFKWRNQVRSDNRRLVLCDLTRPSTVHGRDYSWTEVAFRGKGYQFDDAFRRWLEDVRPLPKKPLEPFNTNTKIAAERKSKGPRGMSMAKPTAYATKMGWVVDYGSGGQDGY
jgi:hypothetical protein